MMKMKTITFFSFVFLVTIILFSCNQPQEIKMYYVEEVYSSPENHQQISLVNISKGTDDEVIYEFNCYFNDERFANDFALKEFWFFYNSGEESNYYIVGDQYSNDYKSVNMEFIINNESYDNLDDFNFVSGVDYIISIAVDYYELSEKFDFDIESQTSLDSVIVRFMIRSGETVFFTNLDENESTGR